MTLRSSAGEHVLRVAMSLLGVTVTVFLALGIALAPDALMDVVRRGGGVGLRMAVHAVLAFAVGCGAATLVAMRRVELHATRGRIAGRSFVTGLPVELSMGAVAALRVVVDGSERRLEVALNDGGVVPLAAHRRAEAAVDAWAREAAKMASVPLERAGANPPEASP